VFGATPVRVHRQMRPDQRVKAPDLRAEHADKQAPRGVLASSFERRDSLMIATVHDERYRARGLSTVWRCVLAGPMAADGRRPFGPGPTLSQPVFWMVVRETSKA